jgi:hypothetical protein
VLWNWSKLDHLLVWNVLEEHSRADADVSESGPAKKLPRENCYLLHYRRRTHPSCEPTQQWQHLKRYPKQM